MKFVNASHEIIPIPTAMDKGIQRMNVYQHLEMIGKTCYKSEDKITDDTCVNYLKMIRDKKHWAMLEHFIFVIQVSRDIYEDIITAALKFPKDFMLHEKLKFIDVTHDSVDDKERYLVSGSATSFNYIWECPSMLTFEDHSKVGPKHGLVKICNFLNQFFPLIMKIPDPVAERYDDCGFLGMSSIEILSRKEIESLPNYLREIHDSMSVRFITNLGVSHDLVRSRPISYAMESTRWINYSKKYGYTYTVPLWFTKEEKEIILNENSLESLLNDEYGLNIYSYHMRDEAVRWIKHLKAVEYEYEFFSKEMGYKPDQSSLLLPKNYKTELVLTTRIHEWKHLFFLRCQNDVRPDMRKIIVSLVHECIESNSIWSDQADLYEKVEKNNG